MPIALSAMNHKNSAPRIARSIFLLAADIGLLSSTGVSIAARRSPSSISGLSSSASLFSLMVAKRTRAEITMSTEAIMKGISMVHTFLASSDALM